MADKYIKDLTETTEDLATGDMFIVEKADDSGTKISRLSNLWRSLVNKFVKNNLTTTESGYVLDARQGKALADLRGKGRYYTLASGSPTESSTYESLYNLITNDVGTNTATVLFNVTINGQVYGGIADVAGAAYGAIKLFHYGGVTYHASRTNSTTWKISQESDYLQVNAGSSVSWESSSAPEAFINAMPYTYHLYAGMISADTTVAAIGLKASSSAAAVLIFTYSGNVHFWVKWSGTWSDRKVAWQ